MLEQLSKIGVELDQKLAHALEISASNPNLEPEDIGFPDSYLTLALYRANSILTRLISLDVSRFNVFHEYKLAPPCPVNLVHPGNSLCRVLDRALELASPHQVIGVGHFLRAVVQLTLDIEAEDLSWLGFDGQVSHNTFSAETLLWGLGYGAWTPISEAPEISSILAILDARDPVEDIQYLVTYEKDRIVFRPTSILDPYPMIGTGRHSVRRLALLAHFREQYGGILPSELMELEDLINHESAKEYDFQKFFEVNPQFLRNWGYREVYSQVYLTREEEGPLIPDFILLDRELQNALLLDLKLPHKRVVISKKNRVRFSSVIDEARAQLLEYRDWFDDTDNRNRIKKRFGLDIYRPRIGVLIGRSSDFNSALERQKLQSRQDLEVYTYDDIVTLAGRRLLLIKNAVR